MRKWAILLFPLLRRDISLMFNSKNDGSEMKQKEEKRRRKDRKEQEKEGRNKE